MKRDILFYEWFSKVESYAKKKNWPICKEHDTWLEYFNDGYSPEEAVNEDISYCD